MEGKFWDLLDRLQTVHARIGLLVESLKRSADLGDKVGNKFIAEEARYWIPPLLGLQGHIAGLVGEVQRGSGLSVSISACRVLDRLDRLMLEVVNRPSPLVREVWRVLVDAKAVVYPLCSSGRH